MVQSHIVVSRRGQLLWLQQRLIWVKGVEKGDCISRLKAIDNCWNRNMNSLGSPLINMVRLPIILSMN